MEAIDLQAAQKHLEEKRESLKQTQLEQISSNEMFYEIVSPEKCPKCGEQMRRSFMFGDFSDNCPPCDLIRKAARAKMEEENKTQREREKAAQQEEFKKKRIADRLKTCGIGQRFMGMTFDDYKPVCDKAKGIVEECQQYVKTFKNDSGCNLLMIGSPGTGKNMMAAIIGQSIIKNDITFIHTTAMKLVRRIKDSWHKDSEETEQQTIDLFVSPSLLVIDEIGVQFGSATEQLFLTEVINDRYEKRRPTILISNLKLSQISEVIGERVVDRFYDDGSKMLVFDWHSYRRQARP